MCLLDLGLVAIVLVCLPLFCWVSGLVLVAWCGVVFVMLFTSGSVGYVGCGV